MRIIDLPCGKKQVEVLDQETDHEAIEKICIGTCEYGGPPTMGTCGSFHDWFTKNHGEVS